MPWFLPMPAGSVGLYISRNQSEKQQRSASLLNKEHIITIHSPTHYSRGTVNIHCTTLALGYRHQGLVATVDLHSAEFNNDIHTKPSRAKPSVHRQFTRALSSQCDDLVSELRVYIHSSMQHLSSVTLLFLFLHSTAINCCLYEQPQLPAGLQIIAKRLCLWPVAQTRHTR